MKKIALITIALLMLSCQNKKEQSVNELLESSDVDALRKQQEHLQEQADSLQQLSVRLSERISELDPQSAILVSYQVAQDSLYNHFISLQANIETDQDAQITPEFGGVLTLLVKEGQNVRRGQLIGRISDGGLADQVNQAKIQVDQARAQLQQAEIQRDLAKTTYERQKSLWDKKIGSEMQFLQARTNYETSQKSVTAAKQQVSAAQRGVSGAQSQLAKTRLNAPFSGRIEEVITQNGQVVGPGTPVVRLVNPSNLKAVANVPETYLPNIEEGTKAVVALPALGKRIESKVSLVSSSINPANRSFRVEVPVPDSGNKIKPNLNAQLQLNDYTSEKAIIVAEPVIRQDGDGKFVFIVNKVDNNQGMVIKKYIEVGEPSNGSIEIISGVENGQIIITEAPKKLKEGDTVELIKEG